MTQRYSLLFCLKFLLKLKKKLFTDVALLKKSFQTNNILLYSVYEKNPRQKT